MIHRAGKGRTGWRKRPPGWWRGRSFVPAEPLIVPSMLCHTRRRWLGFAEDIHESILDAQIMLDHFKEEYDNDMRALCVSRALIPETLRSQMRDMTRRKSLSEDVHIWSNTDLVDFLQSYNELIAFLSRIRILSVPNALQCPTTWKTPKVTSKSCTIGRKSKKKKNTVC